MSMEKTNTTMLSLSTEDYFNFPNNIISNSVMPLTLSSTKVIHKTRKIPRMFYDVATYYPQRERFYETIRFGITELFSDYIMPEFNDVKVIRNKESSPIGVKISFADDTEQKAICMPDDIFNLEQGIAICLFKKMLTCGCRIDEEYVTGIYNKLIKHAIKIRENRLKAEEEAKRIKEEAKLQEQRFQEKRRKTKAKRAKRESERRINEMAEAIRRSGIVPNIDKIDDGK